MFPRHRKVIYVHGCFWHAHERCSKATTPVTNSDFWERKLARNKERDRENVDTLHKSGWQALIIWECETKDRYRLAARIGDFFEAGR